MDDERIDWNGSGFGWRTMRITLIRMAQKMAIGQQLVRRRSRMATTWMFGIGDLRSDALECEKDSGALDRQSRSQGKETNGKVSF
ncbi:hypothetical protein B9Z55_020180 [Caenorhabditis nigoni]|uniref:Uncharacterized protein n=1 Tax=Caenorhabditis nigoni TaxID=1611254 RepID=A0A2G5TMD0_9PELO|nr:hypothetical protein B9Z55_020180 [Caenorhabditis nigoni]